MRLTNLNNFKLYWTVNCNRNNNKKKKREKKRKKNIYINILTK